jgi:diacylglycerol O-acyltransferase
LGIEDAMWPLIERPCQPMHVAVLQIFEPPDSGPRDFLRKTVERLREAKEPTGPFKDKLVWRGGWYAWEQDRDFDLAHHFCHSALPRPGGMPELVDLVTRLHSRPLDRSRPLWEQHIIDGLEGDRFAVYTKIHHSVADGVMIYRIVHSPLSTDPHARNPAPIWAQPQRADDASESTDEDPSSLFGDVDDRMRSLPHVTKALFNAWRGARQESTETSPFQAPRTIFNVRVTNSRVYAAISYPLSKVKAIAARSSATINDVLLAMGAGALRRYLLDVNALPAAPLVVMIPVSVRAPNNTRRGNKVSMMVASLGTHIADPAERFEHIRESVKRSKAHVQRMSPATLGKYGSILMSPRLFPIATGVRPWPQLYNLVISNVPGPKHRLYWNGAPMIANYPLSIVNHSQAINITVSSCADTVEFTILACRHVVPDVKPIVDYVGEELETLGRVRSA